MAALTDNYSLLYFIRIYLECFYFAQFQLKAVSQDGIFSMEPAINLPQLARPLIPPGKVVNPQIPRLHQFQVSKNLNFYTD